MRKMFLFIRKPESFSQNISKITKNMLGGGGGVKFHGGSKQLIFRRGMWDGERGRGGGNPGGH